MSTRVLVRPAKMIVASGNGRFVVLSSAGFGRDFDTIPSDGTQPGPPDGIWLWTGEVSLETEDGKTYQTIPSGYYECIGDHEMRCLRLFIDPFVRDRCRHVSDDPDDESCNVDPKRRCTSLIELGGTCARHCQGTPYTYAQQERFVELLRKTYRDGDPDENVVVTKLLTPD